jgi:hypothetical protein
VFGIGLDNAPAEVHVDQLHVRKTAFLLPPVRIAVNQIFMGAPIGCPKPPLSTEAKPSRNRHLSWGTHKSRTRGSISRVRKIVSA